MKVEVDVLGSPSLSPYGLCGRKATVNEIQREASNTAFGGMYKKL